MNIKQQITAALLVTSFLLSSSKAGDDGHTFDAVHGADSLVIPKLVKSVIANNCIDCHSTDESEGNVRLDALPTLKQDERLTLLNKVQQQLFFGLMPPKHEEQPTAAERARLADWVSKELNKHNASKLEEKLRLPAYGNYVDHDELFSGEYKNLKGLRAIAAG